MHAERVCAIRRRGVAPIKAPLAVNGAKALA
jgi:hypothetical protein